MSQPDSKLVTNSELGSIQIIAERLGHIEAVRKVLNLPEFDQKNVKQKAHWHYVNGPSSFYDQYHLERSWVKAIAEILKLDFIFEIDLFVHTGRSLPEKPDNPT